MDVPLTPVPARESLKDQAINFIVDLIISNDLKSGDPLPSEKKLAETVRVSRVVIREACQVLSARGILRIEHGRGMFVNERDGAPVSQYIDFALRRDAKLFEDLLEARFSFEVQAAGLAASHAQPGHLERLRTSLEKTTEVIDDFEALAVADVEFHQAVSDASGNGVLALVSWSFQKLLVDSRRLTYAGAIYRNEGGRVAFEDHSRILEAIEAHDPVQASEAMQLHLNMTRGLLSRAYEELRASSTDSWTSGTLLELASRGEAIRRATAAMSGHE